MNKLKGLFKNRTFIGIICLTAAALVAFVVLPLMINRGNSRITVVRASADISKGQLIKSSDLELAEVGSAGLPSDCIKNAELVAGKTAAVDIRKNDYIFASKISDELPGTDGILRRLDGSRIAMSVTIDSFAAGLSGKIESGDIVKIVIYKDKQSFMPNELAYVKVIGATTRNGIDTENVSEDTSAQDKLPSTVTLLVNTIQASLLVDYENSSKIHICLVYRGDEEVSDRFLKEQDNYFENYYQDETIRQQPLQ